MNALAARGQGNASISVKTTHQPERFGRLWWLPSRATGNGLSDAGWAPFADIDARIITPLLAELRTAGVPAHAAATIIGGWRPGVAAARLSCVTCLFLAVFAVITLRLPGRGR